MWASRSAVKTRSQDVWTISDNVYVVTAMSDRVSVRECVRDGVSERASVSVRMGVCAREKQKREHAYEFDEDRESSNCLALCVRQVGREVGGATLSALFRSLHC